MSWTYHQATGQLEDVLHWGCGAGYAGNGQGKNNPQMQDVPDVGPLPQGWYAIQPPVDTTTHGPYVLWLIPDPANEMFGRAGFGIHGDSIEHPGLASEGCIILPRVTREKIWNSLDHQLQVVNG